MTAFWGIYRELRGCFRFFFQKPLAKWRNFYVKKEVDSLLDMPLLGSIPHHHQWYPQPTNFLLGTKLFITKAFFLFSHSVSFFPPSKKTSRQTASATSAVAKIIKSEYYGAWHKSKKKLRSKWLFLYKILLTLFTSCYLHEFLVYKIK